MKIFLISLILFAYSHICFCYEYDLVACAIFCEDDLPYMEEWINFHYKQGVEHFYLYNHDKTNKWVSYFSNLGDLIEVKNWHYDYKNGSEWDAIQYYAYNDCIRSIKNKAKWCAIIDTDEFLFSPTIYKLPEILQKYDNCAGVCVNWIMYGSSSYDYFKPDEKITDNLLYRAPMDYPLNTTVKSIVQPKYVKDCTSAHWCTYEDKHYAINENYQRVEKYFSPTSVNLLRINHYWGRDYNFFITKKVPRQVKWGIKYENAIENQKALNDVFDDIIKNYN